MMSDRLYTVRSADGTTIGYEEFGSGPPLVLVHGGVSDRTYWAPILPALTEQFTVVCMDRRGRAASVGREAGTRPRHVLASNRGAGELIPRWRARSRYEDRGSDRHYYPSATALVGRWSAEPARLERRAMLET